jgi:hypothetical protein
MIGHPEDCMCQECASETRDPDIHVQEWTTYDTGLALTTQDSYHMVTNMGLNVTILHAKHPSEVCDYLIVVDVTTGKSIRISFTDRGRERSQAERIFNV